MNTIKEQLKIANYNRKSSEDKDRQVLSTSSQADWAHETAARRGFKIGATYTEDRSAKMPYNRPEFDKLVEQIRRGTINCIICWKLDRLARNPEEAGIILGLLKRGEIKLIITSDGEYRPEDNALISYMNFGMADQYVRDLSKNVKRGQWAKAKMGWRPGGVVVGYLYDNRPKGEKEIIPDPERFDLVQRILRLFLAGTYSVRELQKEAMKWGLKTRQTKRQGGKHLPISHIYRILTNPFYSGWYWWTNNDTGELEHRKGNHLAMITEEEYELIQKKLGNKSRSRPKDKKKNLIYREKMTCGECSAAITGEDKYQIICTGCKNKFALIEGRKACPSCDAKIEDMKKPKILHYIYYHCTKRKNPNCTQRSITVDDLEVLVDKELQKFNLSEAFAGWALEELEQDTNYQIKSQNAVIKSQQDQYKDVVAELLNTTRLYTSPRNVNGDLMSIEEFEAERKRLLAEKKRLESDQEATGRKVEEWIDWAVNSFDFATAARIWFENGSPEQQRTIFFSLSGSNITLKDKELAVSLRKPLDFYSAIALRCPSTTLRFEPKESPANKRKNLPFEADIPTLRG